MLRHVPLVQLFVEFCRTMRVREAGFIPKWIKENTADPRQCTDKSNKNDGSDIAPLSLKNLTGAFIVISIGYVASIIILLLEHLTIKVLALNFGL